MSLCQHIKILSIKQFSGAVCIIFQISIYGCLPFSPLQAIEHVEPPDIVTEIGQRHEQPNEAAMHKKHDGQKNKKAKRRLSLFGISGSNR